MQAKSNISADKDTSLLLVGHTEVGTTHDVSSALHLLQQSTLTYLL